MSGALPSMREVMLSGSWTSHRRVLPVLEAAGKSLRLGRALAALLLCGVLLGSGAVTPEYALKAEFLCNFSKYVEWPLALRRDAPLVFGVVGRDADGMSLLEALRGNSVQGRTVRVAPVINSVEGAKRCHVLFFRREMPKEEYELLKALRGSSVLTVGEGDDFLISGGIVRLSYESGRVRFDINPAATRVSGLKISSQLWRLARALPKASRE